MAATCQLPDIAALVCVKCQLLRRLYQIGRLEPKYFFSDATFSNGDGYTILHAFRQPEKTIEIIIFRLPRVLVPMKKRYKSGVHRKGRRIRLTKMLRVDEQIMKALDQLTEQEVKAIKYRLGIKDGYTHTLKDTAAKYGLTIRTVKLTEEKVIGKRIRSLSAKELQTIIRKDFDDPQWAQKVLAECQEESETSSLSVIHHPIFDLPAGFNTAQDYLQHLSLQGMRNLYGMADPTRPANEHEKRLIDRLKNELNVVAETQFANAFLVAAHIVDWARNRGIPVGPGRGAEAGSILAYCLGITQVDPVRFNLSFEVFLDPFRSYLPSFVVEIGRGNRRTLVTHIRQEYGKEHVTQMLSFAGKDTIHSAALAISDVPMCEIVLLFRRRGYLPVAQCTKQKMTDYGVLTLDLLDWRVLSDLQSCIESIKQRHGVSISLPGLPLDDHETFALLCRGDTSGLSLLDMDETRKTLAEIQPTTLSELVITCTLSFGNKERKCNSFIRRKRGLDPITCPHPLIESILQDTYGILLYKDQAQAIVEKLSGHTPCQAAYLCRIMLYAERSTYFEEARRHFISGCSVTNGISGQQAMQILDFLKESQPTTPRADDTCCMLIAYWRAYMKAHYPDCVVKRKP
jgi:DNA polymerase III alpha subunit